MSDEWKESEKGVDAQRREAEMTADPTVSSKEKFKPPAYEQSKGIDRV